MKKFIQISLVVILLFVLFQAAAGGVAISSGETGSGAASNISATANISADNVHVEACLVRIKGVICVRPDVGWNS